MARIRIELSFSVCEHCQNGVIVQLPDDWLKLVESGYSIPVVACGNPWHYRGLGATSIDHIVVSLAQKLNAGN